MSYSFSSFDNLKDGDIFHNQGIPVYFYDQSALQPVFIYDQLQPFRHIYNILMPQDS